MSVGCAVVRLKQDADSGRGMGAGERGSAPPAPGQQPAATHRPPFRMPAPATSGGQENGPAPSVLVVEDNLINQKILVAFLRKRGYQVDVAADGAEAVQRLAEKRYGIVLMDLQMPVLDGFEATRLIRSLPEIADIPIVAVSAHALNGERQRCLEAGMNGYLAKPVDPAQLYEWVERYAGPPPAC